MCSPPPNGFVTKGSRSAAEIEDVPLVDLVPRHADESPLLALVEPEDNSAAVGEEAAE